MAEPWPLEFQLTKDGRSLTVKFDSGQSYCYPAEFLRVESPSAEVKGHTPGHEQLVHSKRSVAITHLEPVGNYAVRILFSDGHNTGLFTWPYLIKLGNNYESVWKEYLAKLAAAGQSRD